MTLREFSLQTDWPYAELEALTIDQAEDLFALYGLALEIEVPVQVFRVLRALALAWVGL